MDATPGSELIFDHVLLVSNEGEVKIGTPNVEGASVKAEVIGEAKGKKLVIFRFKRRKGIRRKTGHRQHYTKVRITEING
jgi:large subunit ribosomal protein L21